MKRKIINRRPTAGRAAFIAMALAATLYSLTSNAAKALPVETAVLPTAPQVPPPITRSHAARVVVNLDTIEKIGRLADGTQYTFWTFGGTVPGSFIRVRVGDEVEFHLNNHPSSKMPHNIDLHAVTGPGGGATSSFTAPGQGYAGSIARLYAKNKLDDKQWTMLAGDPDDVRVLANIFGVKYKPMQQDEIAHSNMITLVDSNGVIQAQLKGLYQDKSLFIQQILAR